MRTLYLFLISCALSFSSWAQTYLTLPRWTDYYEWHGSPQTGYWIQTFSCSHVYNPRGQETERVLFQGDLKLNKTLHTYGDFGLLETLEQFPGSGGWEDGSKSTYAYDAQGRLTSITQQAKGPDRSSFVNTSRTIYQHTENDLNPYMVLRQEWDEYTKNWLDVERDINLVWSTDQNNPFKLLSYEIQTAPGPGDYGWGNKERHSNSYDPATKTLFSTIELPSGDSWVPSSRTITIFDAQMNPIRMQAREWVSNVWEFRVEMQYALTFNAENALMEKTTTVRRTNGGELENAYKEVYSDFQIFLITGAADQLPESSLAVFPNPTSGDLTITITGIGLKQAQIQLLDLHGKKMYEASAMYPSISGKHVVPCQHLSAGMYILRITTDNHQKISRRVVKR